MFLFFHSRKVSVQRAGKCVSLANNKSKGLNAQFPKGNFTHFIITDGNCMKFYSVKMCLKLLDKYGLNITCIEILSQLNF